LYAQRAYDLSMAAVAETLHALKNHLLVVRMNIMQAIAGRGALDQSLEDALAAVDRAIDEVYQIVEAVVADTEK
jgi:hypothetical protein